MKNILIYMDDKTLAPKGGPLGYCYNVQQEVRKQGIKNIHFLNEAAAETTSENNKGSMIKQLLKKHFFCLYYYLSLKRSQIRPAVQYSSDYLNQYDIIHFHNTIQLYQNRKELETFKGKVAVTSHSPVPYHMELIELLKGHKDYFMFKRFFAKTSEFDKFAYDRADIIIFPCVEAEEAYAKHWNEYTSIHNQNSEKYKYLYTGIKDCTPRNNREVIRKKFGIPDDAFLISYVGRHNFVKGFDNLKVMGSDVLQDSNTYIIVAGKEEPIKRLEHPHWIEVGWTDDAYSIIAASDAFVLPNKETYFDIVFLEVLSLGKIIVASNVGGNKVFRNKSTGVFLYDSLEDAETIIRSIHNMSAEKRNMLEEENRKLFEQEFNSKVFVDHYLKLFEDV